MQTIECGECEASINIYISKLMQDEASETVLKLTGKRRIPLSKERRLNHVELLDIYREVYKDIPTLASKNNSVRASLITITCKDKQELTVDELKKLFHVVKSSRKCSVTESQYAVELTEKGVNHLHIAVLARGDIKASYLKKMKDFKDVGYIDVKHQKRGEDPSYAYGCFCEYLSKPEKKTVDSSLEKFVEI